LIGGDCRDEVQDRGAAAGRQARGLGQRRDGVDGGPVHGREVREHVAALVDDVGSAPAGIVSGAWLHSQPGAVGNAHSGFGEPAGLVPGQRGDGGAATIVLADPSTAPVALDAGPAIAHEPDDTMRRVRRMDS
jgi:hypothetical protein